MDSLISTAREFCTWCKSSPETKSAEGRKAHSLLTRLYAEALELDEPATYNADIESGRVNDEEWKEVYARAAALPFQYYSSQFDPSDVEPEGHEIGDLADDVADIYRDLSEGLALVDAGHIDEAQWAMRFSFLTHWRGMRAEQLGRCTAGMWTRTSSDERPLPLRHGHLQELPLREIMFRVNA